MSVHPEIIKEKLIELQIVENMQAHFKSVHGCDWKIDNVDKLLDSVANNVCDLINDEKDLSDPRVIKALSIALLAQSTLPKELDPKNTNDIDCQFNYRVLFENEHPDKVKLHKPEFAALFRTILTELNKDNYLDEKQIEDFADKLADVAIEDFEANKDDITMKENDRITATFADVLMVSLLNLYGMDPRVEGQPVKPVFYLAGNLFGIPELTGTQPNSQAFINKVNTVTGDNQLGKSWTDSLMASVTFLLTASQTEKTATTPELTPPTDTTRK